MKLGKNKRKICEDKLFLVISRFIRESVYSKIFPSILIVTTCHGMNFPLF